MLLVLTTDFSSCFFFFFNDTATTEIYTLSLHDALPIFVHAGPRPADHPELLRRIEDFLGHLGGAADGERSEEHTSELQSLTNLVCRLLLEKKEASPRRPARG